MITITLLDFSSGDVTVKIGKETHDCHDSDIPTILANRNADEPVTLKRAYASGSHATNVGECRAEHINGLHTPASQGERQCHATESSNTPPTASDRKESPTHSGPRWSSRHSPTTSGTYETRKHVDRAGNQQGR